jgi:hypothetical protein
MIIITTTHLIKMLTYKFSNRFEFKVFHFTAKASLMEMHRLCKIVLHSHPIKNYKFIISYQKVGWSKVTWQKIWLVLADSVSAFFFHINIVQLQIKILISWRLYIYYLCVKKNRYYFPVSITQLIEISHYYICRNQSLNFADTYLFTLWVEFLVTKL